MSGPVTSAEQTWTIARLLRWTAEYLTAREVDEPRLAGEVLLAHSLSCRRINLYARFEDAVSTDALAAFKELIKRAAASEPIAYIVGEKEFFSLPFFVSPDVLIPRPETELLVEVALDYCSNHALERPQVLDLATGSGCIAISILKQLPDTRGVATDISASALAIAARNADRHDVVDRISLIECDGANVPVGEIPQGGFDVLVSNPPYVAESEWSTLPETVRRFEPKSALTDGADGFSMCRSIASHVASLMHPGGVVAMEVGCNEAQRVRELLTTCKGLTWRETRRDRTVGAERVVVFDVDTT